MICGLDAAFRPGRTGIATLEEVESGRCEFRLLDYGTVHDAYTGIVRLRKCTILGVDAPISTPYRGFRRVERLLARHANARLLPGGMHGMAVLSRVGCMLRWMAYEAGYLIVETHPSTTARLNRLSLSLPGGDRHAVDAILAALAGAGLYCLSGLHVIASDGYIVVPYLEELYVKGREIVFKLEERLDLVIGQWVV